MKSTNNIIAIPKPDIFSFDECLHFLDRGYDDCLYSIEENRVIKPLRIGEEQILFAVSDDTDTLKVEILSGEDTQRVQKRIKNYVTGWFDLDRDLHPFYQLLKENERFSGMAKEFYGLRLMGIPDLFEALCWCVLGQQINLTFAHKLKRQLVETYGTSIIYQSNRHYLFPKAAVLAGLQVDDLKELQLSRQKSEYIIGIANDIAEGQLSKQELIDLQGTTKMLKRLKEIRGVGKWTANYALMKSLKRMDCITHGDTGLQRAVSSILELNRKPDRQEVEQIFILFTGWESYLNIYLWRSLS